MMNGTTPEVDAEEAAQLVSDGTLLIDVREDDEFQAGHAPGARHLPLSRLASDYTSLPRSQPIIAVCRSGGRSAQATMALRGAGYEVVNLAGGMQAWESEGHPVVTPNGGPGQVI